jgi:hypothetical protein
MDPRIVKRFNRTHISRDDFARARRFIKGARPYDVASTEYEALLIAAVIFYARPFSNNERKADAQSTPRLADKLVPFKGEELKLHKRILLLRNRAVAHGESAFNRVQFVPPFTAVEGEGGFATWGQTWHIASERLDLDKFEHIADEMIRRCVNHLFDFRTASR